MWRFHDDADAHDEHLHAMTSSPFIHSPLPFSIPLDIAPLAICIDHGVVIGIGQEVTNREYDVGGGKVMSFKLATKVRLIMMGNMGLL